MPKKTVAEKYFTPKPRDVKVVTDRPRRLVIINMKTGQVARTHGFTLDEAIRALGWSNYTCHAVDFGPSSPGPFIVRYQAPAPIEESTPVETAEPGKE